MSMHKSVIWERKQHVYVLEYKKCIWLFYARKKQVTTANNWQSILLAYSRAEQMVCIFVRASRDFAWTHCSPTSESSQMVVVCRCVTSILVWDATRRCQMSPGDVVAIHISLWLELCFTNAVDMTQCNPNTRVLSTGQGDMCHWETSWKTRHHIRVWTGGIT